MGLPDVEKANEVYVDALADAMKGVTSVDQLSEYARHLAPMGQIGLKLFQSFIESSTAFGEAAAGGASGGSARKKD